MGVISASDMGWSADILDSKFNKPRMMRWYGVMYVRTCSSLLYNSTYLYNIFVYNIRRAKSIWKYNGHWTGIDIVVGYIFCIYVSIYVHSLCIYPYNGEYPHQTHIYKGAINWTYNYRCWNTHFKRNAVSSWNLGADNFANNVNPWLSHGSTYFRNRTSKNFFNKNWALMLYICTYTPINKSFC